MQSGRKEAVRDVGDDESARRDSGYQAKEHNHRCRVQIQRDGEIKGE